MFRTVLESFLRANWQCSVKYTESVPLSAIVYIFEKILGSVLEIVLGGLLKTEYSCRLQVCHLV